MERISRDYMLMEVAHVVAQRGTCSRLQVGAVFAADGRILVTGYNGAPRGLPHCYHAPGEVLERGCDVAEHAERNAVGFAAGRGIALGDSDLYVTHAPCLDCARTLLNVGIRSVTYDIPYRLTAGVDLLTSVGIRVIDTKGTR